MSRRRHHAVEEPSYRRSPTLLAHWAAQTPIIENYATGHRARGVPIVHAVLAACDEWRSIADLSRLLPERSVQSLTSLVKALVRLTFLERSDRTTKDRAERLQEWGGWNPSAAYFHFATRDVKYSTDLKASGRRMRAKARHEPLPPTIKRYRGCPTTRLPKPDTAGEFPRVLESRRTWRRFARAPVSLEHLSDILALTFRVQEWVELPGIGKVALKTSPSGGARHPIECYVLALRVDGLSRGLYHYRPDTHALERLSRRATPGQVGRYLPGQGWYSNASVLVLMTAVFARTRWRYPSPRAYRVILAETGHVCQTFCLAATWRGLAPFCTMALADSIIERDLGIDGVSEAVMYAAGFGSRPAGAVWAPWPTGRIEYRTTT
jgi:SagB-type dehydrogenase family enzyme